MYDFPKPIYILQVSLMFYFAYLVHSHQIYLPNLEKGFHPMIVQRRFVKDRISLFSRCSERLKNIVVYDMATHTHKDILFTSLLRPSTQEVRYIIS